MSFGAAPEPGALHETSRKLNWRAAGLSAIARRATAWLCGRTSGPYGQRSWRGRSLGEGGTRAGRLIDSRLASGSPEATSRRHQSGGRGCAEPPPTLHRRSAAAVFARGVAEPRSPPACPGTPAGRRPSNSTPAISWRAAGSAAAPAGQYGQRSWHTVAVQRRRHELAADWVPAPPHVVRSCLCRELPSCGGQVSIPLA